MSNDIKINADSTIRRAGELMTAEMDDELVMMSVHTNAYYGLDDIGREIWESLESPVKIDELCGALAKKYKISKSKCEQDVIPFLTELADENIIIVEN